jgi:gamma-glutamyltranspeptidase/glutathione hydrolase
MEIIKRLFLALAAIACLLSISYLLLPKGPREQMGFEDPWRQARPMVTAEDYIVVTGTPWATAAAIDILENGGNAFDAASAALLSLNVTYGEAASFPGVAPLLIHDAATGKVRSYTGAGTAPARATIDLYRERGHETVPLYSTLSQLIPASPDVLISLLSEYGSMSFQDISQSAIKLAKEGFPVHRSMTRNLKLSLPDRIGFHFILPYASQVYFRGEWWRPLHFDDRFIRPDLANTFESLVLAEQEALAAGSSREEALVAVRNYFYKGPVARRILAFHEENDGLFSSADLADYKGGWETPLKGRFEEYEIFTNGTWSQGIVVPMVMQILEPMKLREMGHNTPAYIHTVLQAIELAMADREAYVADSGFVAVPVEELLDRRFAEQRRTEMRPDAFGQMPNPGIPAGGVPEYAEAMLDSMRSGAWPVPGSYTLEGQIGKDTSYIAIIDQAGNSVSLTPSDFPTSPMVPGTGLTLGVRMTQFRLLPEHPASLEPGKRPRITPHAVMLFKLGKFYMSIGTPGGDMQAQANVQVLLNHIVFGMDIQSAIEAPRFRSNNFPDSFAPHVYRPGLIELERSLQDRAGALEDMGYRVVTKDDWENSFSAVGAVIRDNQQLKAGADPREETWAQGR